MLFSTFFFIPPKKEVQPPPQCDEIHWVSENWILLKCALKLTMARLGTQRTIKTCVFRLCVVFSAFVFIYFQILSLALRCRVRLITTNGRLRKGHRYYPTARFLRK